MDVAHQILERSQGLSSLNSPPAFLKQPQIYCLVCRRRFYCSSAGMVLFYFTWKIIGEAPVTGTYFISVFLCSSAGMVYFYTTWQAHAIKTCTRNLADGTGKTFKLFLFGAASCFFYWYLITPIIITSIIKSFSFSAQVFTVFLFRLLAAQSKNSCTGQAGVFNTLLVGAELSAEKVLHAISSNKENWYRNHRPLNTNDGAATVFQAHAAFFWPYFRITRHYQENDIGRSDHSRKMNGHW